MPAASLPRPKAAHATPTDGLLRAREVAQYLRVGIRTVWKLKATNRLPAVRILNTTRFRRSDVERLAQEGIA